MEMKDLAIKLGLKNILISTYNNVRYKDEFTIILNDYLLIHLVGRTVAFVPLTIKGINKAIDMKSANKIIDTIK